MRLPKNFRLLMSEIEKLPGVGPKSAMRLAIHLIGDKESNALALANALAQAKKNTKHCKQCGALTEDVLCEICTDPSRDSSRLCIVESVVDLLAIERTGFYKGLYHVLGGVISPLEGVDESQINLDSLLGRVGSVEEIIYALPSSIEADATFLILKDKVEKTKAQILFSKVAIGLPVGSNIDYADNLTLIRSFENRVGS